MALTEEGHLESVAASGMGLSQACECSMQFVYIHSHHQPHPFRQSSGTHC